MARHDQHDLADPKQAGPSGPAMPAWRESCLTPRQGARNPETHPVGARSNGESPARQAGEPGVARKERAAENGRSSFGLEEICTVSFRCEQCQTEVRFPRIRWASSPECCPNCGVRWMRRPNSRSLLPEDEPTYVFQTIFAFREALQALAGMGRNAEFTLILETDACGNHEESGSAETRHNVGSHT